MHGVSHKTWSLLEYQWYTHIQAHNILPLVILSCLHDTEFLELKHLLVRTLLIVFPVELEPTTFLIGAWSIALSRYQKESLWLTVLGFYYSFLFLHHVSKIFVHIHKYSCSLQGNTLTSQGMDSCIQISFSIHFTYYNS